MSEGGAQTIETGALTSRVEMIEREMQALTQATVRGKRVRLIIFLLALVLIVCIVSAFYNLVREVTSKENLGKMGALAQQRLGGTTGAIRGEVDSLIKNARPLLMEAFQKQVEKDMPKFREELDKQRVLLVESLQKRFQSEVAKRQEGVLNNYVGMLVEEFPEAADEKLQGRMMANLGHAMQDLIQKYYVDEFETEFDAMYETWDTFPVVDPPSEGDDELHVQLGALLWDLFKPRIFSIEPSKPEGDQASAFPTNEPKRTKTAS